MTSVFQHEQVIPCGVQRPGTAFPSFPILECGGPAPLSLPRIGAVRNGTAPIRQCETLILSESHPPVHPRSNPEGAKRTSVCALERGGPASVSSIGREIPLDPWHGVMRSVRLGARAVRGRPSCTISAPRCCMRTARLQPSPNRVVRQRGRFQQDLHP
jgi:hypothetical protein